MGRSRVDIFGFLSTPSGWRATPQGARLPNCTVRISIHALRVEGDERRRVNARALCNFYPRPPGGGRPQYSVKKCEKQHFYPRPPGGGRRMAVSSACNGYYFYPRPPGGGRQVWANFELTFLDFYPRPPGGGRPSANGARPRQKCNFYPRPPGGGRPSFMFAKGALLSISIHALRVEGDVQSSRYCIASTIFLSTPSGWRATT